MPFALYLLALAVFAMGTSEFMLAGLVPDIAASVGISVGTAGLLTSAFAVGMILGAPAMAALTRRWPARSTLLGCVVIFAACHVIAATAETFSVLFATRVVAAVANAGFLAVALSTATSLVAPNRKGRALAILLSGTTIAMVAGVPAGALLGTALGWRATFWAVAFLCVPAAIGILTGVRPQPRSAAQVEEAFRALLDDGWDAETKVLLGWGISTTEQTSVETTLGQAPGLCRNAGDRLVVIMGQGVDSRGELAWFETKPLFGWQVLIPRTKEQGTSTAEALAELGAVGTVVPTIAVQPPRTPTQMEKAIRGLVDGSYEWVGFTSVNAVRAVRMWFEDFGLDARSLSGVKVAAVGGRTAAALTDWGITPDLIPDGEHSARGLAAAWPDYVDDIDPMNTVLLPRADIATEVLVAGLLEKGWDVDDVTAYRTVRASPPPAPIREAIKAGDFDAFLFTSSSTVRNLVGIAGKPAATSVICCIGPATANTAEEHGLRVDVLAEEANLTSLIDGLVAYATRMREADLTAGVTPVRPSQKRRRKKA